jgi:hypothetical protein
MNAAISSLQKRKLLEKRLGDCNFFGVPSDQSVVNQTFLRIGMPNKIVQKARQFVPVPMLATVVKIEQGDLRVVVPQVPDREITVDHAEIARGVQGFPGFLQLFVKRPSFRFGCRDDLRKSVPTVLVPQHACEVGWLRKSGQYRVKPAHCFAHRERKRAQVGGMVLKGNSGTFGEYANDQMPIKAFKLEDIFARCGLNRLRGGDSLSVQESQNDEFGFDLRFVSSG